MNNCPSAARITACRLLRFRSELLPAGCSAPALNNLRSATPRASYSAPASAPSGFAQGWSWRRYADRVRAFRNIAIICLLALVVAGVPGGDNAAQAVSAAMGIVFLALIAVAGWQLYRQHRFAYMSLEEQKRGILLGSLGAIVLMVAGADEMTNTGGGLLVWIGVLALAIFFVVRTWLEAQSRY
jgi:peptidoglycan/LPS O-acetylase OafA/YrhL